MKYENYAFMSLLVDDNASFDVLSDAVILDLNLTFDPLTRSLRLVVGSDFGAPVNCILELKEDRDVKWFIDLIRNNRGCNSFPLIVDFVETRQATASLVEESFCADIIEEMDYDALIINDLDFENFPRFFDVKEGNMFLTKEYLVKVMKMVAIRRNFDFRVKRSCGERLKLSCVVEGCLWGLYAKSISGGDMWRIKKYVNQHTCSLDTTSLEHRQASSKVVSECLKSEFLRGIGDHTFPKDIVSFMHTKFGVDISYYKARKARDHALQFIRGSPEESYALLPSFAELLKEKNPGLLYVWFLLFSF